MDPSAAADLSQTAHSPPPLRLATVVHHTNEVGNAQILQFELFIKKNPNEHKVYSYFTESSFKGAERGN